MLFIYCVRRHRVRRKSQNRVEVLGKKRGTNIDAGADEGVPLNCRK
jgi:hypothetical protein